MFNKNDYKALDTICNMVSQGKFHFFTQNFLFDYQAIDNAIKMLKSRKTTGKLVCNIINDENIVDACHLCQFLQESIFVNIS